MNEVFNKWREAIEYAEQRRGVRDYIENRQANALVECAYEARRLDMELARMLTGGSANVVLDRWGGRIVAAKRIASGNAQAGDKCGLIGDAHCIRELATEVELLSAREARWANVVALARALGTETWERTADFLATLTWARGTAMETMCRAIDAALKEGNADG